MSSISGRASSFGNVDKLLMVHLYSLGGQAFRQSLPGSAQAHMDGRGVDFQKLRDLVCVIFESIAQSQYFSVRFGKLLQLFSQLPESFLAGQAVQGEGLASLDAVHCLGRLRAEASEGALGVILRQV